MTLLVTVNDMRAAKMCGRAARVWFERQDLSWSDFVTDGIDAERLRETKDPLALKVVAIAEARAGHG